jgi:hypothetical protein
MYPSGTQVRLIKTPDPSKVKDGATARVVDGLMEFPFLYSQLLQKVGHGNMDDFIWIKWDRHNKKWNGQGDGAYSWYRFEEIDLFNFDDITEEIVLDTEPRNNDNRSECFWCLTPTEKKQGLSSFYDICPKCKK